MWWIGLVGCASIGFVDPPRIDPNTDGALLTAWVVAETAELASLEVTVSDGESERVFVSAPGTDHRVLIGGLLPSTDHTVEVMALSDLRRSSTVTLDYTSDPLPSQFVPLPFEGDAARMEPGLTLVGVGPYMTMVDPQGRIRWLAEGPGILHEYTITTRGTVMYQFGKQGWAEMSLSGALIREFVAGGARPASNRALVALDTVHHDVVEMPNGNWLALSAERRFVEGYPRSETDPESGTQDVWVAGDVVAEVDPTGAVLRRWSVFDALEPTRIGFGSVDSDYWDGYWGGPTRDWSHGNSVWYDEQRGEVLVSLRHQDAVVAFDYESGDLAWVFAPDENWPEALRPYLLQPDRPELVVPYHQHAAKITPSGELLMFDNGNHRTSPPERGLDPQETASRAASFVLDHDRGRWDLAFDYGSSLQPPLFSGSLGDADLLEQTGNVLVTYGNVRNPGMPGAIVREVTRDAPPQVVFDLSLPAPLSTFRAQRVEGVFPGF